MKQYAIPLLVVLLLPLAALASSAVSPVLVGNFWAGFKKYWSGLIASTDGVVLIVIVVAAVALFIITRGKWIK